jgi:nucleoside-diphosphate-sugar epimerase
MRRLFLTGATGFIGGRLAEIAVERGIPTTAMLRSWARASRLARLPIEMVPGDVLDLVSLRAAMKGCDTVIHCAVDNRVGGKAHRETSAQGTRNVMQAALELGVQRVVHLSSIAVYSYKAAPDAATEQGAYGVPSDDYCHGKILAERIARSYFREHGLPVTILRPTIVYGPFGVETLETVDSLRQHTMVLVNGGTGVCNSLHVDNLADAALLAAEHDKAAGEIFHISDARPVQWREFIEPHARALGEEFLPIPEMTLEEITAFREQRKNGRRSSLRQMLVAVRDPAVRRALRSVPAINRPIRMGRKAAQLLLPEGTRQRIRRRVLGKGGERSGVSPAVNGRRGVPSPGKVDIYANKVVFSIDKARQVLGYDPRVSFAEGIEQTIAWMKWARL